MISIVVPFYNERDSVEKLFYRLREVCARMSEEHEFIFVDDGSHDGTIDRMKKLSPLRIIRLARNYGQTQALGVGIRHARGDIIITLDGDLENDPADIPLLLQKLHEGYDVVSGWRKNRWNDKLFSRRIPSSIANTLISVVSGVQLHDHGCALKAYRRFVLERVRLTGEMHRMIAAYAAREGARVAEVHVHFHPRVHGASKYGLSRTFRVLLDILAFHFFYKYAHRPIHFFGGAGFLSFFIGFLAFLGMLYFKYFLGTSFIQTPLPVVVALCVIIGFQFILMGLLAEIVARNVSVDEGLKFTMFEN